MPATIPSPCRSPTRESPPASTSTGSASRVTSTLRSLTILTSSLPSGTQNSPYNAMLAATGGVTPYTWSIAGGALPRGLVLTPAPAPSPARPPAAGASNFTVKVTDSEIQSAPPRSRSASPSRRGAVEHHHHFAAQRNRRLGIQRAADRDRRRLSLYLEHHPPAPCPRACRLNTSTGAISGTPVLAPARQLHRPGHRLRDRRPSAPRRHLSITINPRRRRHPASLSGHYAFYLNGFNSTRRVDAGGQLHLRWQWQHYQRRGRRQLARRAAVQYAVTGSYSIATTGLNTITLQGQSLGPMTFAFVLDSTGNGRIIEYDDTTGQGSRGSGALRKATSSAFSLSALHGGWVLGLTGLRPAGRASLRSVNSL